jgi:hypothetical protein
MLGTAPEGKCFGPAKMRSSFCHYALKSQPATKEGMEKPYGDREGDVHDIGKSSRMCRFSLWLV